MADSSALCCTYSTIVPSLTLLGQPRPSKTNPTEHLRKKHPSNLCHQQHTDIRFNLQSQKVLESISRTLPPNHGNEKSIWGVGHVFFFFPGSFLFLKPRLQEFEYREVIRS